MKRISLVYFSTILLACGQEQTANDYAAVSSGSAAWAEFLREDNFDAEFDQKILPYWEKGVVGVFQGQGGVNLHYRKLLHPQPKANLLIVAGYGESELKYRELAYDLGRQGFSVYIFDHRGQGFSDRLLKDSNLIHVDKFQYYIDDLKAFIDTVINQPNQKLFVFAHSMGGLIAARLLEQHPYYIDAAVLSSPMLEINTGAYPQWTAKLIVQSAVLTGFGEKPAPGKEHNPVENWTNGSDTSSTIRFARHRADTVKHGVYLDGTTNNWVNESMTSAAQAVKEQNAKQAVRPILLFQAGRDTFVKPGGQETFCQHARRCQLVKLPEASHAIYIDTDAVRGPYLRQVVDFFAGHALDRVPVPAPAPQPNLTFTTFNTGLADGHVDHYAQRLPLIIDELKQLKTDVLCLNELWKREDQERFIQELKQQFPYAHYHWNKKTLLKFWEGQNGLLLLSKLPLVETDVVNLDSFFVQRDALYAKLSSDITGTVGVICTHLSTKISFPPYLGRYKSWEDEQNAQAASIASWKSAEVIMGDLNSGPAVGDTITAFTPEAYEIIKQAGYFAPYMEQAAPPCSWCEENSIGGGGYGDLVLDHVFFKNRDFQFFPHRVLEQNYYLPATQTRTTLSDHAGVSVALTPKVAPQ